MAHVIDNPDDDDTTAGDLASADASADESEGTAGRPAPADRPTSHRPAAAAAALVAVNVAAFAFVGSHWALQHAGEHNSGVTFLLPWPDMLVGLVWVASAALLVRAVWGGLGVARHVAAGGLIACVVVVPAVVLTSASRADRYQSGLQAWAATRFEYEPVRSWAATSGGGGEVPPASWPAQITAAEPSAVEKVPGNQGVILRWGTPGGWVYARRVFVATTPRGAPLDDGKGGWRAAAEGVYVGLQHGE